MPATVSFVDIAGIVKGASEGEGLGNKFLANIREADAICQVVRAFADQDVVHVAGRVDPADDIEVVHTELILADLQTLEKAVPRLDKEVKGKKTDRAVLDAAVAAQDAAAAAGRRSTPARPRARSTSPRCASCHCSPPSRSSTPSTSTRTGLADAALQERLRALVAPADAVFLDAKLESELAELDAAEAAELLAERGPERVGPGPARPGRASTPSACRPTSRPGRRRRGPGRSGRAGRRRRPPASSTPTSSGASSRPRSSGSPTSSTPARWRRRRRAARCGSRARTT